MNSKFALSFLTVTLASCSLASAATILATYADGTNSRVDHALTNGVIASDFRGGDLKTRNAYSTGLDYLEVPGSSGKYWTRISSYDAPAAIASAQPGEEKATMYFTLQADTDAMLSISSFSFNVATAYVSEETSSSHYMAYKLMYRVGGSGSWTNATASARIADVNSAGFLYKGTGPDGMGIIDIDVSSIAELQNTTEIVEFALLVAGSQSHNSKESVFSNLTINGDVTFASIPEPFTATLGLYGLGAMLLRRRR